MTAFQALGEFEALIKHAAQLDPMEVRNRRKKLKIIMMSLLGAAPGAALGMASALPSQIGAEADRKSILLRTLLGAGIGASAGGGAAWVGNKVSDYADLDPLLPSIAAETRYRG